MINRFLKQIFCKHDWRPKGNPIDCSDFYFHESRCPKCKKIKQTHKIKNKFSPK